MNLDHLTLLGRSLLDQGLTYVKGLQSMRFSDSISSYRRLSMTRRGESLHLETRLGPFKMRIFRVRGPVIFVRQKLGFHHVRPLPKRGA